MANKTIIPSAFKLLIANEFTILAAKAGFTTPVYFDYGHYKEITNRLKSKDKAILNKGQKYPLIWLVMDFEQQTTTDASVDWLIPNLQMIIATSTKKESTTPERMSQTFDPLLIPVYELLLQAFRRSTTFFTLVPDDPQHSMWLRPYWDGADNSGNGGNLFDDFIDAIQLKIKNLVIKSNCQPSF
jgi:hypothetical protein